MNDSVSRSWLWAGCFAFALLLGACGGGDDGLASFASDDGVVSIDVPPGAAPDGFSGSVSLSDPSALGVDVSDIESVILVYDLGPDGTTFEEPVTVTFRIPAALGGFDPGLGVPLAAAGVQDADGGYEPLGSLTLSLDGDVLVIEGTTTHFSRTVVHVLDGNAQISLHIDPASLTKQVETQFQARISERGDVDSSFHIGTIQYSATDPVELVSVDEKDVATFACTDKGKGIVRAAVLGNFDLANKNVFFVFANAFTGGNADILANLFVEIECVEPAEEVEEPPTEEPPATGSDPEGDGKNENSEPVSSDEDVPGADIKSVSHVRGSSGEHCFIIVVYGDGKKTATDPEEYVGDYLISVEIRGADGWGASVRFNNGVAEPGRVFLGENASGRDTLEGAEVSVEWIDSDTMKVTVTGTELEVGEFDVVINVFSAGGSFYDHAEGVGQS